MVHRYVKRIKRTTAPRVMVCAAMECDSRDDAISDIGYWYSARRVWSTYSRRSGDRWSGDTEPTEWETDDFWEYIAELIGKHKYLYMVCDRAGDMLTATGFWKRVDRGEYRLCDSVEDKSDSNVSAKCSSRPWQGQLVLGSEVTIVRARHDKGSITIVSSGNYSTVQRSGIHAQSSGSGQRAGSSTGNQDDDAKSICGKCKACTMYMQRLISEWVREQRGPWRDTIGQLSVSLWRSKYYNVKVCTHDDDRAIRLEKDASHGGRMSCWYYGDVGSLPDDLSGYQCPPHQSRYHDSENTIYRCDVSSQYPTLLRDELYPVRLLGVVDNPSLEDLNALHKYYGVIASVRIQTDRCELPHRRGKEIHYPAGEYDTTIAGADISYAIDRRYISRVYRLSYYQLDRPLQQYANALLEMRSRARALGDTDAEIYAKALSTAIGGKFAQRYTTRIARPEVVPPISRWGHWSSIGDNREIRHYMAIAGIAYEEVERIGGHKLLPAIYCYLTAYSRQQMRAIREVIEPIVPYSQATDGIWVGESGLARLVSSDLVKQGVFGCLAVKGTHHYGRWYSPIHYYVDGVWTLSGYTSGYHIEPDMTIHEYRDKNPMRYDPHRPPMRIMRSAIVRQLSDISSRVKLDDRGWAIPIMMKG